MSAIYDSHLWLQSQSTSRRFAARNLNRFRDQHDVAEGRALVHCQRFGFKSVALQCVLPFVERAAIDAIQPVSAQEEDGAIYPVAVMEGQAARGIADAGDEGAAGGQRGADAAQHVFLVLVADVVQHVEDDRHAGLAEVGSADVALRELSAIAERGAGALHVFRHELQTPDVYYLRRGRPVCGPVAGLMQRAGFQQPGSQQPLSAAEVDQSFGIGDQAVFEQAEEHRVAFQFASGEMPGEAPCGAVGTGGTVEQGAAEVFGHGMAERKVTE